MNTTTERLATDKQVSFIHSLLDQVGPQTRAIAMADLESNWTSEFAIRNDRRDLFGDRLPIGRASRYIERLIERKADAEAEHEELADQQRSEIEAERRNEAALAGEDRWEPIDPREAAQEAMDPQVNGEYHAEIQRREAEEEQRRMDHKFGGNRFLQTEDHPDVPAGRYAVTGEDGTTDFYKVDVPTRGRWVGTLFVKLHVAGRPDTNLRGVNALAIISKIESDGARNASIRYGKELGECGRCGRELTNNDSIEAGIGPVCAAKAGWDE